MADGAEAEWSSPAEHDAFWAMESLQATLQQLEAGLRHQDVSEESSTEYCDSFCQALMHYAGSRNSVEHGLSLLEVYCLSINCFAAARPHLTADSPSVALVLKRLALSCFELLLSVPQNEIPIEAWLQFHGSVQAAHEAMSQYGSMDLQALLQITGEGGAWSNPTLVALLTGQPTDADEVNAYLALEGDDFLEMRIKHLEKVGEVEKALILTKACGNCSLLSGQANFRQTFVTQLCQLLPSEEAIVEISRLDGKDVLDIICNMETEGDENTAFILCTTYFTQQLQQESLYCSWELTLLWSKLQRRIDGSLESFLERCLQFGAIAKTVYHLLFLIRVIQTETMHFGLAVSVELCVKALQLPRQEDTETKTTVCKTVACLLPDDLEVLRACQLTEFLLSPSREVFDSLEDLYGRPDQKYDEENAIIPNSLRCELLLALKAHWPFDPEFWDWKTLKHYCIKLLGLEPEEDESEGVEDVTGAQPVTTQEDECAEKEDECETNGHGHAEQKENKQHEGNVEVQQQGSAKKLQLQHSPKKEVLWTSERAKRWQKYKFLCQICQKEVIEPRFLHHSRKHLTNDVWTCPVCLQKFESKDDLVPHSKEHLRMPTRVCHLRKKKVKKKEISVKKKLEFAVETEEDDFNDLEPGQIPLDPSLVMYYQSTHDPVVLEHILEQAATVPKKPTDDDDDYITFDYIYKHFKLQDREIYPCPATDCSRTFKLYKYLGVHLKNEHDESDPNVKHYMEMKDRREKCTFCRRTFMSSHHHRQHRRMHYGEHPYMCVVAGCCGRFDTTNELLAHKHSHGFLLAYHCELKGCSLSFCDLGQLYHHEAQHFRDAAYTCTGPGCKKFYYCRKEFLKHLETHGITFSERDFEAQRKAKRKLMLPIVEDDDGCKVSQESKKELLNGAQNKLPPSRHLECKESKGSLTCVAVCFDGKKFTCGLEKCGRTFNKAREIQKHLKIVHPDQFKEENKVCKVENEDHSKDKFVKDNKSSRDESPSCPSIQGSSQENVILSSIDSVQCESASSSKLSARTSHSEISDALTEIVLGLSQLSLNSAVSSSVRRNPRRHSSESKVPQVSSSTTSNVKSPAKATPNKIEIKSQQAPNDSKRPLWKVESPCKAESPPSPREPNYGNQTDDIVFQQPSKPYTCDVDSCGYESVTSYALVHHYVTKHEYSEEEVKQKDIFNPLKFRPFKCHLCSKGYKERKELKAHYRLKHNKNMAVAEQTNCSLKKKAEDTPALQAPAKPNNKESLRSSKKKAEDAPDLQAPTKPNNKEGSGSLKAKEVPVEKKNVPTLKDRPLNKEREMVWVGKKERRDDKIMSEDKKPRSRQPSLLKHGPAEGKTALDGVVQERRASQRLVTKGNKCMDDAGEDESYYCVHKGCGAAFMKQYSLLRHLQNVHHYNTSQVCWDEEDDVFHCKYNGCNKQFNHLSSLNRHYRKEHQVSEEPIPRFRCTYANCNATYHLKSSLLRHTNQTHQNQTPMKPIALSSAPHLHSKFSSFKKHIFYRRCDNSIPLVVRLQSSHKRDGSNSGCQKKLIIRSSSQSSKVSQRIPLKQSLRCCSTDCDTSQTENFEPIEEAPEEEPCVKPKSKKNGGEFVYRTPEEALQMCQDRCLPVAYPCMVQNCDSVVSSIKSMRRHYIRVHKMVRSMLSQNQDKLFYTAEKLEELIQKKSAMSALPDLARVPNGVLKMEYQAEPENPGGPSLPMSLHSIKTESMGKEVVEFSGELSPDSSVLIVADDVLYGESNGRAVELLDQGSPSQEEQLSQEEWPKTESPAPPLVPPPPLDLSPPSKLRITVDDVSQDPLGRESKPVSVSTTICIPANPTPTRQPLRRKNSELSEPLPAVPHPPAQKDQVTHSLSPKAFDIATYKPLGFESSFLKFIQEKEEHLRCDKVRTVAVLNTCYKPDPTRRRDLHRRNGSVKENDQRGPVISRGKKSRSLHLKPLLSKGECSSIQNLRFILERALRGCGDQAIKQLQFLKPVVVLERHKSSASFLDLLPPETKA
ncbi:zinc finger protein Rlf [Colossoma macropomum]|uniref:zinc finger protein Rlf n=1 Tax=Colossoma macropomum TaxID=42526 RepID=UPI0018645F1E|nr:zinc finger protein Rlf [Colossoma macropomum]